MPVGTTSYRGTGGIGGTGLGGDVAQIARYWLQNAQRPGAAPQAAPAPAPAGDPVTDRAFAEAFGMVPRGGPPGAPPGGPPAGLEGAPPMPGQQFGAIPPMHPPGQPRAPVPMSKPMPPPGLPPEQMAAVAQQQGANVAADIANRQAQQPPPGPGKRFAGGMLQYLGQALGNQQGGFG